MPDFLNQLNTIKAKLEERASPYKEWLQRPSSGQHNHHHHHHQTPIYHRPPPATPYWTATFSPSVPISQEWRHETGAHGWGNAELEDYTSSAENSFIRPTGSGGAHGLVIRAIVHGASVTSARLTSRVALGRDRGHLSARITAPSAKGIWPAFWLLPTEPFTWPSDGEIDVMESWNDDRVNHSCLHWGQHGSEGDKHRVVTTHVPDVDRAEGHTYGLAWDQQQPGGREGEEGVMVWYVDGRPVMRAGIPRGMRRVREFQVKLNVAVGGNVMQGRRPADGVYEMVVHEMGLFESPPGGWEGFARDVGSAPEGRPQ